MNWIGRANLEQANYPEAEIWYQRSLDVEGDSFSHASAVALHELSRIALLRGEYDEARKKSEGVQKIMQQVGDRAGEASTWHNLATIDLARGEYEAACQKLEKALDIRQQIGDRAGEAATLHQLATIDLRRGEYDSAFQKFETALGIEKRIGDRAGEAATFFQLGQLTAELGQLAGGVRLVALCYLIDASIGHGDAQSDFQSLSGMASKLNYTQEQFEAMLREVAESYQRDRGRSLIDAAFGED